MTAQALAILGTGSDVGKTALTAALCRILSDRGFRVAPYKAQNMSNNAGVTLDGLEMARAQILQAQAARVEPEADMNPVLLKPATDTGCQVIVHGRVWGRTEARGYFRDTSPFAAAARAGLDRLRDRFEVLCLEGAGSCAEVNLRDRDFVNFRSAEAAGAAVLLAGDIDRGGIFAQLLGTLDLLEPRERARVRGLVVNKFRGDLGLFRDGVGFLERRSGLPVLGVIPWLHGLDLDAEDGLPAHIAVDPPGPPDPAALNLAVIYFPHIANFTDFEPLRACPGVALHYLYRPRDLSRYDALLLPGSKHTRADLEWLRASGWERPILSFPGKVLGLCGGYQMLGAEVGDPDGVEGEAGWSRGLGLLGGRTVLGPRKRVARSAGHGPAWDCPVSGYEIHLGETTGPEAPFAWLDGPGGADGRRPDGAISPDGRVAGTYLHGILDATPALAGFLAWVNGGKAAGISPPPPRGEVLEANLDRLARHVAAHLDMDRLLGILEATPFP